jgi:hypothetical protein
MAAITTMKKNQAQMLRLFSLQILKSFSMAFRQSSSRPPARSDSKRKNA